MMSFVSTRDPDCRTDLATALFGSTAPDGGLWMPRTIPTLTDEQLDALLSSTEPTAAALVLARNLLAGTLEQSELESVVRSSLDFRMPLVELEPGRWVLELFHGPTLAFKDVGARFMARLMSSLAARDAVPTELREGTGPITVLVATSGDTGSAVAHAFHALDGFRVVVLYPRAGVSEAQRRLFTTLGDNVRAVAVDGVFDDCQRLVKQAFADAALRRECKLVSANSINVGRWLPQSFYYAWLAACSEDRPLLVSVPSGNFGNLTAGLVARRAGVPLDAFVAATNVNDAVPEFLDVGVYRPRPSRATVSNAMDVGDPSNFERLRWLYPELDALRAVVRGARFTDEQTITAIRQVHERTGYVLDPHGAVGYLGLDAARDVSGGGVVLATAHPAKFDAVIERALGHRPERPEPLVRPMSAPESVVEISTGYGELRQLLQA